MKAGLHAAGDPGRDLQGAGPGSGHSARATGTDIATQAGSTILSSGRTAGGERASRSLRERGPPCGPKFGSARALNPADNVPGVPSELPAGEGGPRSGPVAYGRRPRPGPSRTMTRVVLSHYLGLRRQGVRPRRRPAAGRSVLKVPEGTTRTWTDFEKNVMRTVFPWYSFTRRKPPADPVRTWPRSPAKLTPRPPRPATGIRTPGQFVPGLHRAEGARRPAPPALPTASRRLPSPGSGLPFEGRGG